MRQCVAPSLKTHPDETIQETIRLLETRQLSYTALDYASLIRKCGAAKAFTQGKRLEAHISTTQHRNETFLTNLLVQMYGKCGRLTEARSLFDSMQQRNVHSWTITIAAYAQNGHYKEALFIFRRMYQDGQRPDRVTYTVILAACSKMGALQEGRDIHRYAEITGVTSDVVVGTAVLTMYGKCGELEDARRVFNTLQHRNTVTYNAMMSKYKQNGRDREAVLLFNEMYIDVKPDRYSYSIVLEACTNMKDLSLGRTIHWRISSTEFEKDVIVATALVNMYSKCDELQEARRVFDIMEERDSVSWNAMIAAYAHHGQSKKALDLYKQMQETTALAPLQGTFTTVIDVCAELSALKLGRSIHERVLSTRFEHNLLVSNALVHMYGKCGCLPEAVSIFRCMRVRDGISWNTIISSYAYHGHSEEAHLLYREMDSEGVKPTDVTFVSILSSCNHGGLVNDGLEYFHRMRADHNIEPGVAHYGCIVDLLGRGGRLAEAEYILNTIPLTANGVQWVSLLAACKIHGDVKRGTRVGETAVGLSPKTSSPYVLLANMYSAAGRFKDAQKIWRLMEERGVKKVPGVSSIEVGDTVHEFISGDLSHPQLEDIYTELQKMVRKMTEMGYVPDTSAVHHNVEEEDKQDILDCHSEKLAIVFGHMATPAGQTLRIVKNLRVCSDCHTATKFVSRITKREIIVRDGARFHCFQNGQCSCKDYW